jgi:hypothetical protein
MFPPSPTLPKLLGRQDVLLVLALVVAWGVIVADVDGPVGSGAELLGASNRLGTLPDDLGEVTGGHRETGSLVVVLADLVVPGIDAGLEVLVPCCQVLSVLCFEGGMMERKETGRGEVKSNLFKNSE